MLIRVHGGVKVYRGAPAAARHYVEAGRGLADDYYLAEGTGIAERWTASHVDGATREVTCEVPLTGDAYEAWVAGPDPTTGEPKGRLRKDDNAVRFVEVTVNGPKSWSLAAELHPDISAAYDAAQDAAARQIIAWVAQHATTRVGPRGGQIQVPVGGIDAVTVRHHTSRAGDPHRHLHLQINSRVHAQGRWRGLHTVGVRDSIEAINGIGHAAVMTDPGFRAALAKHGFTLDPGSGEVVQLAPFVAAFSARAAQIGRHLERYEADWRAANPHAEPGPGLRRAWDRRAWADARPDKIVPADGAELSSRWVAELHALGYRDQPRQAPLDAIPVGQLDRERAAVEVVARVGARRSGWNAADLRGQVEALIAAANIVTDPAIRTELAEDLTARAVANCVPLLDRTGVPDHIRALTSPRVLEVETDLTSRLAARATTPPVSPVVTSAATRGTGPTYGVGMVAAGLDRAQRDVVDALTSEAELVVVEGAAGAGKTTTLAATRAALGGSGRGLRVVTPTLKAARVAEAQVGTGASSAAWLAWQHGYRWDDHGVWTRLAVGDTDPGTGITHTGPAPAAVLAAGDLLLVDEAGMLDQDAARALLTIADEHQARVALVGDRHQLPAVGRGGVLDLAARFTHPDTLLTLEAVHRFTRTITTAQGHAATVIDEKYARLSLAMRAGADPDDVFDALVERGQIRVHGSDTDRVATVARDAVDAHADGVEAVIVADTNDQVDGLNQAVRDQLIAAGRVDDTHTANAASGQVGVGDRVVTRRNDVALGVANRDTWTVTVVHRDGSIVVDGGPGDRRLPAGYVAEFVQLGYASTVHGVQGDTTTAGHLMVGEHTNAASAYVGMTRGRHTNTAHLVADNLDDARAQWVAVFGRDRADLGPTHAAELAAREAANYARLRPLDDVLAELRHAWTLEADALDRVAVLEARADTLRQIAALRATAEPVVGAARIAADQALVTAQTANARAKHLTDTVTREADRIRDSLLTAWDQQRPAAYRAADTITTGTGRLGQRRATVRAAHHTLAQWAAAWQPYIPDLPSEPDQLTRRALSSDDRATLWTALDQHAHHRATELHPEHATARTAAADAHTLAQQARTAYRDAARHLEQQLHPYGRLAHTPDPAARLADTEHILTDAHTQRDAARNTRDRLEHDPTIAVQPDGVLTRGRRQWQLNRVAEHRERAQKTRAPAPAYTRGPLQHREAPALEYTPPSNGPSL